MKNLSVICLLGIIGLVVFEQSASAWINSQFGVGLNWNYASGGNSALCGLWRNRQPGAPEIHHSLTSTPAYPVPTPCAPQAAPVTPFYAPTGAEPAGAVNANTQSLRYPSVPAYRYPVHYYRGY